ncbi:MAG: CHAP domain-containing protein [Candidatus Peribacteraceae bacterium]|nr:CHAP domain-containing protein [Candidatus Peribacteraceae bacterium]
MIILKKGSKGDKVKELQKLLNKNGFQLKVDGIFAKNTLNAVKAYQSQNLDKHGRPLVVDGKVGDITWWSLNNTKSIKVIPVIDYHKMPDSSLGGSKIGRKVLEIAIAEMNGKSREIGGNNLGRFVAKYLRPASLEPPQYWCASFVSWCFLHAVKGNIAKMPFSYSAGARDIRKQFRKKGWTYSLKDERGILPEPGDIVIWWRGDRNSWKGHIGLVHHYSDGFLYTIEGNRSYKVEGFEYKTIQMERLLGFGRENLII